VRRGDRRSAFPAAEALRIAERPRVEWRRAGGRSGTTPSGQLPRQESGVTRFAEVSKSSKRIAAQLYL
jgi:hypothetical protein